MGISITAAPAAMSPKEAFYVLEELLHSLERRGYDEYTPKPVAAAAIRRARAIRAVLGMEPR